TRDVRAVALVERAQIAVAGAGCAARLLGINGTARRAARAALDDVALAGGRSALGSRVARRMLAAGVRSVALIERAWIRIARAGRAVRLLGVARTRCAAAGTRLGLVALAGRSSTHRSGCVRRASARPVAIAVSAARRRALIGAFGLGVGAVRDR